MYDSQCGWAPPGGSCITPPTGPGPAVHIVYGIGPSHAWVPHGATFV